MLENQFDDIIRHKLLDHDSALPPDMWGRVDPNKDRRRRGFFWIWTGVLLLCLFGGGIGYFSWRTNRAEKGLVSGHPGHLAEAKQAHRPGAGKIGSVDKPATIDKSPFADNKLNNADADKTFIKKANARKAEFEAPGLHRDQTQLVASPARESEKKSDMNSKPSQDLPALTIETTNIHFTEAGPDLSGIPLSSSTIPLQPGLKQSKPQAPGPKHKGSTPESNYGPWYIEGYFSPEFPVNSIMSSDAFWAQREKDAQHPQFSFSGGGVVTRTFGPHFSGKVGLQFTQLNIRFNGTDSSGGKGTLHMNGIDVPLLVGYGLGDDFRVTFTGGPVFNIYTGYKGEPVNSLGNTYKANTGISLYLGVDLQKYIQNRFFLFAAPFFQYHLSNMTTGAAPFQQRIHLFGISIGARYGLGNKRK